MRKVVIGVRHVSAASLNQFDMEPKGFFVVEPDALSEDKQGKLAAIINAQTSTPVIVLCFPHGGHSPFVATLSQPVLFIDPSNAARREPDWGYRPDGKPRTLGDLTPEQQKNAWRRAGAKIGAELADPTSVTHRAVTSILHGPAVPRTRQ